MIEEVLPGLVHWRALHPRIRRTVHSGFLPSCGTLIDPMVPEEGLEAIAALGTPRLIVLSNRHHYRDSARFVERFGCPVHCHEAGLYEFGPERPVRPFHFDELLAADVRALQLGSICPEETTLLLDVPGCALWFADGLTRTTDGSLAFMPDWLLGDEPDAVRAALCRNLARIHDEESFDALLFAHAEPILTDGYERLGEFLAAQPAI